MQKRVSHLFSWVFCVFISLLLAILILATTSDGATYLLLLQKKYAQTKKEVSYHLALPENSTSQETLVSGGTTSSTNGTGLNLLLISKMNESYIKEMLNLYKDMQEGKLSDRSSHIEVGTLIGMQVNETGVYNGTKYIPVSYLPCVNGKVIWNETYKGVAAGNMTLAKFGDREWNQIHGGLCPWMGEGVDGMSDRTPWCIQQKIPKASAYNKTGKADQHFMPDIINYVDQKYYDSLKSAGLENEKLPAGMAASFASITHNRGGYGGGLTQLGYGIAYSTSGGYVSQYLDSSKYTKEEKLLVYSSLSKLISDFKDNMKPSSEIGDILGSSYGRWIAVAIAYHTEGWYLSSMVEDDFNSVAMKVWNVLYPNEKIRSVAEGKNKIHSKVKTLAEAVKEVNGITISSADTKRVYNTSNDYDDGPYITNRGPSRDFGSIFKVHKQRSKSYKHKYADGSEPFLVSQFDIVCAGHSAMSIISGDIIYSNLLKLGGVSGIDPTNPSTYFQTITNETDTNTWIPSGNVSWYASQHVDTTKLTIKRAKILSAAYNLHGIRYKQCRNFAGCDGKCYNGKERPSHLDCSSFVWRVYWDALGIKNLPINTFDYTHSSSVRVIPLEEALPGDLIRKEGHVEMFLSNNGGYIYATGSHQWGVPSGFSRRRTVSGFHNAGYKVYRVKALDD